MLPAALLISIAQYTDNPIDFLQLFDVPITPYLTKFFHENLNIVAHRRYLGPQDKYFTEVPLIPLGPTQLCRSSGKLMNIRPHYPAAAIRRLKVVSGNASRIILDVGSCYHEEYDARKHVIPPEFPFLMLSEGSLLPIPLYHYVYIKSDVEIEVEYEEVEIALPENYKFQYTVWKYQNYTPQSSCNWLPLNHSIRWIRILTPWEWSYCRVQLDDDIILSFTRETPLSWVLVLNPTINFSMVQKTLLIYDGPVTNKWHAVAIHRDVNVYMCGMLGCTGHH